MPVAPPLRLRGAALAVATAALLSPAACDGNSTVPAGPALASPSSNRPSPSPALPSAPLQAGYEISDVRLVTLRDPVVYWQVSFDARWAGSGPPDRVRCRWRMLGGDGVAIISGGFELEQRTADDEIAVSVYPDEIPGVPKNGALDCKS